ncbi:MAG: presenilin family intramembrane aspartyl protease [Candidatus Diapherotrites archaeon]
MEKDLLIQLAGFFLIVNILGLWVGYNIIQQDIQPTIVNDNPEDPINSFGLIGYMLVGTIFILLAIKFFPDNVLYWVLKATEVLALVITAFITFWAFVPEEFAILLAVALITTRVFLPQYLILRNVSSIIATVGVGSMLGSSIGVFPVIIFLVLLGIYDYIAVFKTKHMVTMAKAVAKKNLSFTFALPTKKHQFELGTGDLVMPLVFSVSVLNDSIMRGLLWPYATLPSLLILIASFIGLAFTMDYGSKNIGKALPALPLQVGLMILTYGAISVSGIFP